MVRMKIRILIITAALLLCIFASSAEASTPFTVVGFATGHDGLLKSGISISVRNVETGNVLRTVTTTNGFYQVNLGNMPSGWSRGNRISINASYWDGMVHYYGYASGQVSYSGYVLVINVSTLFMEQVINENFKVSAPVDIYAEDMGLILMKLVDKATLKPMSGMANNISCWIQYPNGTIFVEGQHPIEDAPGVYTYFFNVGDTLGIYRCWATCIYGNSTLMDVGLFTVKWNVYENISRLYERIGNIIYLEHWDNYNLTQQLAYQISSQSIHLANISRTTESTDFMGNLQRIAVEQAIGVLFWTIALSAFSIIGAVFYTHRRSKRDESKIFSATTSGPQMLVSELTRMNMLRKAKR